MVRRCAARVFTPVRPARWRLPAAALAAALAGVLLWAGASGRLPSWPPDSLRLRQDAAVQEPAAPLPMPPAAEEAQAPPLSPPASEPEPAPVEASSLEESALPSTETASAPREALRPSPVQVQPAEAPKPAPETAAVRPPAGPQPPEVLGTLKLHRHETISGLIHKVYGSYSSKHFRFIILANPHIVDPDRVEVGHPVRMPAIPVSVTPLNKNVWWVKIVDKASLQEAFDLLRNYPDSAPSARLIPCWQPARGLRFIVILKQRFSSPETARLQLALLPPTLIPSGEVISSWGEQTVFFADPYFVSK
jgi:hypothetical protein